jgi:general secretion pathway protein L
MTRFSPLLSRTLALLLLLAAIAAVWLLAVEPLRQRHAALDESIALSQELLQRFARETADPAALEQQRDALLRSQTKTTAGLLRGDGLRIVALDVATEFPGRPLGVNLLPQATRPRSSRLTRGLAGALSVAAVVLLTVALQIPLQRKGDYAAALDARVTAERTRVGALRRLEEEIAGLQVADSSLEDLKRRNAFTLALLDQVTRLLPDDAWLNQLSVNGERLDLGGFSPNSSKLVTTFEESPQFTETVFRAPVTQDPRLGLERFSLSTRLTPGAGR